MLEYQTLIEFPSWATCFNCHRKIKKCGDCILFFPASEFEKDDLDKIGYYCCESCLENLIENQVNNE